MPYQHLIAAIEATGATLDERAEALGMTDRGVKHVIDSLRAGDPPRWVLLFVKYPELRDAAARDAIEMFPDLALQTP